MSIKRRPIRKKVQRMVLGISLAALALASAMGILSMRRIQEDSEAALIHQMEQNLFNIVISKAELADSELGKYAEHVQNFAGYLHGLYQEPSAYLPREILPPSVENANRYVMQRDLRDRDVSLEDVRTELNLLGNVEQVWKPVMAQNSSVITTVYLGTKSGFMLAYDNASQSAVPGPGDSEGYYNYAASNWYQRARSVAYFLFFFTGSPVNGSIYSTNDI